MKVFFERTPVDETDLFVILDSVNKGFDYPIHNHPEYELTLVMGSAGNRVVGDSRSTYEGLDLVLLGPYIFHKWDDDFKKGTDDEPCRVITIQFDNHLFDQGLLSRKLFADIKEMLSLSSRGICYRGSFLRKASVKVEEVLEKKGFQRGLAFFDLLNFLSGADEFELLASEEYNDASMQTMSLRMQRVNQFLIENFRNPDLKISDVAEVINLSDSAFGHFFKKSTKKSFTGFLIEMRLRHSRNLLIETDEQVSMICYKSGFNNHANFNRLFKKKYKITPLQYRKRFLEDSNFDWNRQKAPGQFVPMDESGKQRKRPTVYDTTIVHS
jgi:AraC-like DNA-binding protein